MAKQVYYLIVQWQVTYMMSEGMKDEEGMMMNYEKKK